MNPHNLINYVRDTEPRIVLSRLPAVVCEHLQVVHPGRGHREFAREPVADALATRAHLRVIARLAQRGRSKRNTEPAPSLVSTVSSPP